MSSARVFVGVLIITLGLSTFVDLPVFKVAFSVLLVLMGLKIIFGKKGALNFGAKEETHEDILKRVVVFSALERKVVSDNFGGGEIVLVFSGGEIDLSEASTEQKSLELSVVAVFGGLKVRVPSSWSVQSEGVGIVGAFNNNTKAVSKKTTTLKLSGVAIMGGVEITN